MIGLIAFKVKIPKEITDLLCPIVLLLRVWLLLVELEDIQVLWWLIKVKSEILKRRRLSRCILIVEEEEIIVRVSTGLLSA